MASFSNATGSWELIIREMEWQSQRLETEPGYEIANFPKLDCIAYDIKTPSHVRNYAWELRQKSYKITMDRVIRKCEENKDTGVEDLTRNEKMVLDRQNLKKVKLPESVVALHWKVAYDYLKMDMEDYAAKKLRKEPTEALQKKVKFLMEDNLVPKYLQGLASAFWDKLSNDK